MSLLIVKSHWLSWIHVVNWESVLRFTLYSVHVGDTVWHPANHIFFESLSSGDDNDQHKDIQKDKNKDTDKYKYKVLERLNVCYIFKKQGIQEFQIWHLAMTNTKQIFQGWISYICEYLKGWIFFRGEYFKGWIFFRGEYFSGVNIFVH